MKTSTQTAKHTEGPWTAEPVTEQVLHKTFGAFRVYSGGEEGFPIQRTEANTQLIASAPGLLQALEAIDSNLTALLFDRRLDSTLPEFYVVRDARDKARAAIARATQST